MVAATVLGRPAKRPTVGYGDVSLHNTAGRIVAVCVMLTTVPVLGPVSALHAGPAVVAKRRRMLGLEARLPATGCTLVLAVRHDTAADLGVTDDPAVDAGDHIIELVARRAG